MMDKDEAVQRLARQALISTAHAEDLYDSFFEKPVVPQYVANWYEGNKEYLDYNIWEFIKHWDMQPEDEFKKWMIDDDKNPIITLVNMHQFGYEVEKETKYIVKFKNVRSVYIYLNYDKENKVFTFNNERETESIKTKFTKEFLEKNSFGWVFDCPGVEVKEVK